MARTDTLGNFLTDVATAIRNKKGTTNTIVASNFDTEIESIESGGGELPTVNNINDMLTLVPQILNRTVENYPKILNTPVVLYTPNTNFRCYCIQKRSSGKYRILWLPDCYIYFTSTSYDTLGGYYININSPSGIKPSGLSGKPSLTDISKVDGGYGYSSSEMDTIDDCINAIQSPNTTYSLWTTNNNFGCAIDTDYKIPVSNTLIMEQVSEVYNILPSQQISANETIEVIQ